MLTLIKMLICEGPECNPFWESTMDDIQEFRSKYKPAEGDEAKMPPPDKELTAQLRALNHTPHMIGNSGVIAKCKECGTVRLYGVE